MRATTLLPLTLALGLLACGDKDTDTGSSDSDSGSSESDTDTDTDTDTDADLSFASDVQPILDSNCTFCHSPDGGASWMDLSSGAYDTLVGAPSGQVSTMNRVEAGDPANSYMYLKVTDAHLDAGGEGDPMPPNAGGLGATDAATVEAWITGGALP